jgi:hypothetical protein
MESSEWSIGHSAGFWRVVEGREGFEVLEALMGHSAGG